MLLASVLSLIVYRSALVWSKSFTYKSVYLNPVLFIFRFYIVAISIHLRKTPEITEATTGAQPQVPNANSWETLY